ncbi:1-acyl-sn-glycerol-3-phosphate acyltransferase [Kibdelosporangium philippinense]|uniref:1-acyl-sn-glycerol-3-phosphate acyltransferase n=2 Tax=Kibdelosporangium philippinense TaxID=211113 RepID=A0ABS8ZKF8_9PSEU|nr:lysophospholipid acyltransferase family protein [Kibdelosporangium philippinense]MCE7007929.1 1-acyl-sn-glycerol-3-phosphate acyltransferase [Kibdelosporangium philippinense]
MSGKTPAVSHPRRWWRLVTAVAVLLTGPFIALMMPLLSKRHRESWVRWWFRRIARAFGVRIEVHNGKVLRDYADAERGALVASNHISWLDIVAVNAVQPMRAQAKKEVASWPIIGKLATAARTVYMDRENLRSLPSAKDELMKAMRAGSLVNVSPEGTTWCGLASGRFRPAMFQAAIDADVPVIPFVIRYRLTDGRDTTAPAFIGDETLVTSLRRTARTKGLVLEVHVLDPIEPSKAANRRELAEMTQAAVRDTLNRTQTLPDWEHPKLAVA